MLVTILSAVASLITIFGLPYLVVSNRRRSPKFSFDFSGSSRHLFERDGQQWCRLQYSGLVRNHSTDPNSITKIYLVVWFDRKRRSVLSFGHNPVKIVEREAELRLPLMFSPRQSRELELTYEIVLTGTHDLELVTAQEPLPATTPGSQPGVVFYLPKYNYELAFEDVNCNLFDQLGLPRNRAEMDLRWTRSNTLGSLNEGHPWPFIKHTIRIGGSRISFWFRRLLRKAGL